MSQRHRREPEIPLAPEALDAKGDSLTALVNEVFSDTHDVEVGAAVDEVTLTVHPDSIPEICRILRDDPRFDFNYLRCISVVDYEDRFEVNYHLFSLDIRHKLVVKANVSPDEPAVPTAVDVWRGANWFERESHDLFGVVFTGHPDLAPLLLYEGFEGFPGRKSFPFHEYDEW
ncbi:MAG: NADH-quinone oxidoreductase subunit C [SAR202 cluster bacterium]|nr:NADH-quinone oxidoreductase subunit C [SAR202 cluster bacterium]MDP6713257.1 NADH-quinone oxidoreductase subunit C [SAR202 cluster bacterium]